MAYDPLSNKCKIAELLVHYIKPGFEAQHGWTSDHYAEMDHLAGLIVGEAEWRIYQHKQQEHNIRDPNLAAIVERLDALIENQQAQPRVLDVATGIEYETLADLKADSFVDDVLVTFTEHPRPAGDDWPRQ